MSVKFQTVHNELARTAITSRSSFFFKQPVAHAMATVIRPLIWNIILAPVMGTLCEFGFSVSYFFWNFNDFFS